MTAEPRYVPPSLRLHFGRDLAAEIDQGYTGSCIEFGFERYSLFADARPAPRPGVWLVIFCLWDERRELGWHFLPPDAWDLVLYGASDSPVALDDVARLVEVSPCLPPEWHLHCSLEVLRALSCTLDVRPLKHESPGFSPGECQSGPRRNRWTAPHTPPATSL